MPIVRLLRGGRRPVAVTGTGMRLADILKPAAIRVGLTAGDKTAVIREMTALAAAGADGAVVDAGQVCAAVLDREAVKTTGIGQGLATPHAKTTAVRRVIMALATANPPIDFASLDGRPVSIVILLLAPPDQTGPYIQALARISKLMSVDSIRARVSSAAGADEVYQVLLDEEKTRLGT
jgi:mannitol/fructose-specific phosphotransferase system IIA component (Ntr-type)